MAKVQSEDMITADEAQRLDALSKHKDEVIDRIRVLETSLIDTQHEIDSLGIDHLDNDEALADPKNAARAFNRKPRDTIERLMAIGVLPAGDARAVAAFLWNTHGLTKRAIGDFITRDSQFCQEVLREFVLVQSFGGADVLPSLRLFLNSFEMNGEAQIVDRVLMLFAQCYCELNQPSVFKDDGNCHIFLYAVMLLQTSLHNPSVKTPMKCNDFIKLCECCSVPREFLVKTYGDIKKRPFQHDKIAAATRGCLLRHAAKKGFLSKQGSRYWAWKKRWFVLMDHCLFYFDDIDCASPRGIVPLEHLRARVVADVLQHPHCFELYSTTADSVTICKLEAGGSVPKSAHAHLRLAAESAHEVQQWISAIEQSSWADEYKDFIKLQHGRLRTT